MDLWREHPAIAMDVLAIVLCIHPESGNSAVQIDKARAT